MHPPSRHPDRHSATLPAEPAASQPVSSLPVSVDGWAVFLDIDGTLLDIAATPGAVDMPDGLPADLAALSRKVGGALALVTGRSLDFVDAAFPGHAFPIAGLHGAEWRDAAGRRSSCGEMPGLGAAKRLLEEKAADWPGVLVEDKGAAFAAHYRLVPQMETTVRGFMENLARGLGERWHLQTGKYVIEIRPADGDKGTAVERFLGAPPFSGRRPLAVGDDITDEAMFAAVNRLGGLSVRVGRVMRPSAALATVESPAAVRDWIARLVR